MKIIGIYLAAGKSSRMGENKLCLPLKGKPAGSLALQTAVSSKLDDTLVIVKEAGKNTWFSPELLGNQKKWSLVYCSDAEKGMSHSLKCGVQRAAEMDAEAVVVMLADQPFIRTGMINHLIARFQKRSAAEGQIEYIAPCYKGKILPPLLLSKSIFPTLMKLKGDQGARAILRGGSLHGICIHYDNGLPFYDMDTKEDYEKARGYADGRAG
ncbi:nucleotidyltransferase family protein [Weizmannia acidilactici]|uniref:nucleotidyltransferase family protein n=1 Tax=Weizmannia acidilactici TaxID=2607726 RepID=UPI00127A5A24|nr:nucleotidyltransferase family protein [Weizmannia acidilactici]GER73584.1 purine catabolism protein PucB [Weizmannia acidilactici]